MKLLESQPVVTPLLQSVARRAAALIDRDVHPHLAVVLVGEHEESLKYIDIKSAKAKASGVIVSVYHLEAGVSDVEITSALDYLSGDEEIHGIIVQLPLPGERSQADLDAILAHIAPEKDVDGLRGLWQQAHYAGTAQEDLDAPAYHLPPMVAAVCLLLDAYGIGFQDKQTVIIGRGMLVGRPLEAFLRKLGYGVRSVDEETDGILAIAASADLLVCGTGSPGLVTFQWVKEGAVVLDCARDVHRDSVDQVASAVSPAQGGLGPLTVAWLLHNTVRAAEAAERTHDARA